MRFTDDQPLCNVVIQFGIGITFGEPAGSNIAVVNVPAADKIPERVFAAGRALVQGSAANGFENGAVFPYVFKPAAAVAALHSFCMDKSRRGVEESVRTNGY